ncbi:MAG: hypothetical protein RMI43_03900 [Candidatus Caldarchaeum sp.]|nr:hypothetical protein [Candidatus Caldarchaeum sp.]
MLGIPSSDEFVLTFSLFGWILFVTLLLTKKLYQMMIDRGVRHNVAVYFNRKIIHVLTGGVAALVVGFFFKTFTLVALMVAVLAVGNYLPHRRRKLMYWYQVEENMFEVHFIIMWGLVMGLGFLIGDVRMGVVPILFMSVGDGVTGFVRNAVYRRRTKSWWGNVAMAAFCIPVGFWIMNIPGAVAGAAASLIEKIEYGRIDDNITVPLVAFGCLQAFRILGVNV